MPKKENFSQDFLEKKKSIELLGDLEKERHQFKMKELEFARETDKIKHEQEMERGRIKSAEIRKTFERKQQAREFDRYAR